MARVVIVGAGISGLALAYRLWQFAPSLEITILEQRDRPGGTVWTEQRQGFRIELGPNGFLDNKPSTVALCRDLGLGDRLVPAGEAASRNRYLFLDGKLKPLPGSLAAFLSSDLLSWRGKLAFVAERFRRRRTADSDETVAAFARRRAGQEVAALFADALVTGIYAGDPALLSIRATFPRLAALEKEHGSIIKGLDRAAKQRRLEAIARGEPDQRSGRMWSFRDGLRLLIETLRDRLSPPPMLGIKVRRLERTRSEADGRPTWLVLGEGQDRWTADAVVLACPAYRQAAILEGLDRELSDRIGGIPYNRIAVVALGYQRTQIARDLNGFGFIAPQRSRRDLLGVQWCSSIFADRAPPGMVLLRAMCGGWHRPEVAAWDDSRLLEAVRAELRLAMGITSEPNLHHIVRWERAIPQYHLGHLERVVWIEKRVAGFPGLFLGGNAYHGVALNDCTEQAEILATQVSQYLLTNRR